MGSCRGCQLGDTWPSPTPHPDPVVRVELKESRKGADDESVRRVLSLVSVSYSAVLTFRYACGGATQP